jgi:hypothetical protein
VVFVANHHISLSDSCPENASALRQSSGQDR